MTTDKGGRPTVVTAATVQLLEGAYSVGATDAQACLVAGISTSTLYNYQEANPGFVERKNALKGLVGYQAKVNLAAQIAKKNLPASQWYLERREKADFSTRTDISSDDGSVLAVPVVNVNFVKPKQLGADEEETE